VKRASGEARVGAVARRRGRDLSRVVRAPVAGSLVGKAGEFLSLAVLVTLVPRLLGPAHYGAFALALSIVLIASSALALGGPSLMARYVPTAAPEARPALARALVTRVAVWRFTATVCLVLAAIVLALVAPSHFPPGDTALVTLALAFDVVATLLLQAALGLGMTWAWNLRWALQNSVLVAATVLVVVLFGKDAAVAGVTIASASALALALGAVAGPLVRAPAGAAIPVGALRFGLLQGLSGLFILVTHRGGVVAVALLGGVAAETGFAGLAIGVALAATYTVWQMFASQLPGLAGAFGADPERAEGRARHLAWAALLLLLPAAATASLLLGWLVPAVFGDDFSGAERSIAVALAVVPLAPLTALGSQLISLRLRPHVRVASSATGACAFALTAAVAVPVWGAAGGALALLAGTVAGALVTVIALPAALGARFVAASVGGAALVLLLGLVS
jgi:O-antigen/teichoic acid export membrane protein